MDPKQKGVLGMVKRKRLDFGLLTNRKNTKGQIIYTGSKSTGIVHSRNTVSKIDNADVPKPDRWL